MTPMKLSRDSFADFKTGLRDLVTDLRSAHADEALAAAFGHRTYASLRAALAMVQTISVAFDRHRLLARLAQLGYAPTESVPSDLFRRCIEIQHLRIFDDIKSHVILPANDNRSA